MKTDKIAKAKNKAKTKIAAKIAKAGKTAAKTASVVALVAAVAGCAATGQQPARSQTMYNDFRDCVIIAGARSVDLDTKTKAADAQTDTATAPLELWTQTQANEGSETVSPTASPTNTTDVDTALDVPVNKANTGTSAAGGAAEKLLDAGAGWVSAKIGSTPAAAGSAAPASPCQGSACNVPSVASPGAM